MGVAVVLFSGGSSSTVAWHGENSLAQPRLTPGAVEVDVIGDSLSTGYNTPGDPWTANAQQWFDARHQNVQIVNAAENEAGYVTPGENGDVFLNEVDQIVTARSQVVLIFGSDNDLGQPGITPAITATLNRIKSLAPDAHLIVVGPPAPPADQPAQLTGIRDALRAATQHAAGTFVDPLSLGWLQGDAGSYVGPDREHPNLSGEQYLAAKFIDLLEPVIAALNSV